MRKVRIGMFETNSSMVHAITVCTQEEWNEFKNGKLFWDSWKGKLIEKIPWNEDEDDYYTYEDWKNMDDFECFEEHHKLTGDIDVVVFGYYGHD